jgi:dihydroxyacid dehydratase/phosphogluconate dehydratase
VIDERTILFMRGTGPIGYSGSAEVVNMPPPAALIKRGITELPCIGDGRRSGTSGSSSILNASPEAAIGGSFALLKTGDRADDNPPDRRRPRRDLRRRSTAKNAARHRGEIVGYARWVGLGIE